MVVHPVIFDVLEICSDQIISQSKLVAQDLIASSTFVGLAATVLSCTY